MEYYVYYHKDPITSQVKYVGKGKNGRAYNFGQRHGPHRKWINDLKSSGLSPAVEIVFYGTEQEVLKKETELIEALKSQGILNTLTKHGLSGGRKNGMFGKKRQDLAKRNRSQAGKTYEELYGKEKADIVRSKLGGKPIIRSDGQIFQSIKSAAKYSNTSAYLLLKHLNGNKDSVNSYTFQYVGKTSIPSSNL